MDQEIYTIPAAQLPLEALAEIFTAAFEGYFYPGTTSAPELARRIRIEQIDLWRSAVLVDGERTAGLALLALRGDRAWCGGFGVYAAARGRGLAHILAATLIAQAREAGAQTLGLEVLTRNERAIHTYRRAGLAIWRDLAIFEWKRPEGWAAAPPEGITEAEPGELLAHFGTLHPAQAAWQRDLPALLTTAGLRGLRAGPPSAPGGYLLYHGADGERLRVADLGARDAATAERLLRALQQRASSILTINEPLDSPLTAAYPAAGFAEIDRQHEMAIEL
jgi:ribosomal protein S18 acetylase RimI-like enzyme